MTGAYAPARGRRSGRRPALESRALVHSCGRPLAQLTVFLHLLAERVASLEAKVRSLEARRDVQAARLDLVAAPPLPRWVDRDFPPPPPAAPGP